MHCAAGVPEETRNCCGSGDAAPPVKGPPEEPKQVVKTFDASTASRTPRTAHRARTERVGRGRDGTRRQLSTTSSPGLTPPSPMRHPDRTARACDHRHGAQLPRGVRRPQRESPNAAQTPCQSTRSARQHSPLQSPRRCTIPTPSHTSYARPSGAGCLRCSVRCWPWWPRTNFEHPPKEQIAHFVMAMAARAVRAPDAHVG